jgi:ubiquinone/menaquinone biosynthesis C-methylase UbiE
MVQNQYSNEYYAHFYKSIQRNGVQGFGNSLNDRLIERLVQRKLGARVLEVGASSGEHLKFVSESPKWSEYVCLDLLPGISDPKLFKQIKSTSIQSKIRFVKGDAENLPFDEGYFDNIVSTCLLAHVSNPGKVLNEMRRVAKPNAQIVIGMPCDPGMINRIIKTFVTYPKLKKHGIPNPRYQYAIEHKNGINNLIEHVKFTFIKDSLRLRFFPIPITTWNFNLLVLADIKVLKS